MQWNFTVGQCRKYTSLPIQLLSACKKNCNRVWMYTLINYLHKKKTTKNSPAVKERYNFNAAIAWLPPLTSYPGLLSHTFFSQLGCFCVDITSFCNHSQPMVGLDTFFYVNFFPFTTGIIKDLKEVVTSEVVMMLMLISFNNSIRILLALTSLQLLLGCHL